MKNIQSVQSIDSDQWKQLSSLLKVAYIFTVHELQPQGQGSNYHPSEFTGEADG